MQHANNGKKKQTGRVTGKQRENSDGVPANSLANLRPFPPGRSGNPSGRPKGAVSIWTRVRRKLKTKITEGENAGKRYADLVAEAYVQALLAGSWQQMKELLDREEGKPADTLKIGDADDGNRGEVAQMMRDPELRELVLALIDRRRAIASKN